MAPSCAKVPAHHKQRHKQQERRAASMTPPSRPSSRLIERAGGAHRTAASPVESDRCCPLSCKILPHPTAPRKSFPRPWRRQARAGHQKAKRGCVTRPLNSRVPPQTLAARHRIDVFHLPARCHRRSATSPLSQCRVMLEVATERPAPCTSGGNPPDYARRTSFRDPAEARQKTHLPTAIAVGL